MFGFILFALFAAVCIGSCVCWLGMEMFMKFIDVYVKLHINEKSHSKLGNWVFAQFTPEYLDSLKKGEAF